jgi:hypothetical protein
MPKGADMSLDLFVFAEYLFDQFVSFCSPLITAEASSKNITKLLGCAF